MVFERTQLKSSAKKRSLQCLKRSSYTKFALYFYFIQNFESRSDNCGQNCLRPCQILLVDILNVRKRCYCHPLTTYMMHDPLNAQICYGKTFCAFYVHEMRNLSRISRINFTVPHSDLLLFPNPRKGEKPKKVSSAFEINQKGPLWFGFSPQFCAAFTLYGSFAKNSVGLF